jgi:hypothetical protein
VEARRLNAGLVCGRLINAAVGVWRLYRAMMAAVRIDMRRWRRVLWVLVALSPSPLSCRAGRCDDRRRRGRPAGRMGGRKCMRRGRAHPAPQSCHPGSTHPVRLRRDPVLLSAHGIGLRLRRRRHVRVCDLGGHPGRQRRCGRSPASRRPSGMSFRLVAVLLVGWHRSPWRECDGARPAIAPRFRMPPAC